MVRFAGSLQSAPDGVSPFSVLCPPLRGSQWCVPHFASSREELRISEHGRSQRGWSGGIPGAVSPVPPPVPPATQCVQGRPLGTVGLTRSREDANGNAGGRCKVSDRRGGICWQSAVCFVIVCPPLSVLCSPLRGSQLCVPHFASSRLRVSPTVPKEDEAGDTPLCRRIHGIRGHSTDGVPGTEHLESAQRRVAEYRRCRSDRSVPGQPRFHNCTD